jgi:hypothetical protein
LFFILFTLTKRDQVKKDQVKKLGIRHKS